ncbi:MAG TPA: hypothetical protein PLF30_00925 [Candidatus Moranbacteria bacterium]|jgi:hypothetical protein|nr:hypothetical protein [Candidatus Moranbacteria bacterium]HOF42275.1 hypothetical protein [Candidatus Moranbacteria bacterium]HPX94108.1 hypothetical protein [Candidatus Moranbacteria bacterium]HQB59341.1 hypothetical protein [Candidatus Moranbacteria bacterium]
MHIMAVWVYLIYFSIGLAVSMLVAFYFPQHTEIFTEENGLVESIEAILYVFSGIIAIAAAIFTKSKKYVPLSFSILGFLLFMEEISWGRDMLKYENFTFLRVRIDSAHDFVEIVLRTFDTYWYWHKPFVAAALLLIFVSIAFILIRKLKLWKNIFSFNAKVFLIIIFFMFLFSSIIDSRIIRFSNFTSADMVIFEEYFELSASVAWALIAIELLQKVICVKTIKQKLKSFLVRYKRPETGT